MAALSGDAMIKKRLREEFDKQPDKTFRVHALLKLVDLPVEKRDINRCLYELAKMGQCEKHDNNQWSGPVTSSSSGRDNSGKSSRKKKRRLDDDEEEEDNEGEGEGEGEGDGEDDGEGDAGEEDGEEDGEGGEEEEEEEDSDSSEKKKKKKKDKKKKKKKKSKRAKVKQEANEEEEGDGATENRIEGDIKVDISPPLLEQCKEKLLSVLPQLRELHKIHQDKKWKGRMGTKATSLILRVGKCVAEVLEQSAIPDDGVGGDDGPTVRQVKECMLQIIEENEGQPPTVKVVRNSIQKTYKSFGRTKKEMRTMIKDLWQQEIVWEYHLWFYVSLFCGNRHWHQLRQLHGRLQARNA